MIVGRTKGDLKKNEFLVTDKPYGDFTLKAKVKIRNGNSGIQFRSDRAENGAVSGPQADVADGYWGLLYEERRRGILSSYPADKAEALVRKGTGTTSRSSPPGGSTSPPRQQINGIFTVIDRTDDKRLEERDHRPPGPRRPGDGSVATSRHRDQRPRPANRRGSPRHVGPPLPARPAIHEGRRGRACGAALTAFESPKPVPDFRDVQDVKHDDTHLPWAGRRSPLPPRRLAHRFRV